MSKIFVEIDYFAMAQWAKYSLYNLEKSKPDQVKVGINRMINILDQAANRLMFKESEVDAT